MNTCVFRRIYPHKRFLVRFGDFLLTEDGEYMECGTKERAKLQSENKGLSDSAIWCQLCTVYCPECHNRFLMQEAAVGRLFTREEKKLYLCELDERHPDIVKQTLSALGLNEIPQEAKDLFAKRADFEPKNYLQCPHCQYGLHSKDVPFEESPFVLTSREGSPICVSESVWKGEESVTYQIGDVSYVPGYRLDDPWIPVHTDRNLTVNIKTKRQYIWTKETRNGIKKSFYGFSPNINVSSMWQDLLDHANRCNAFIEAFPADIRAAQSLGHPAATSTLEILINKTAYPTFSASFHEALPYYQKVLRGSNIRSRQVFLRKLKTFETKDAVLRYAVNRLHVSPGFLSKKDKLIILKNPLAILAYETGIKLGITDHNIIRNNCDLLLEFTFRCDTKDILAFLREVFSKRWNASEIRMLKDTVVDDYGSLYDSARMYDRIKTEAPEKMPKLQGNITDIHDALSDVYYKLTHEDVPIPYRTEEVETLETKLLGYDFYLPKHTYDLWNAGRYLHNCVVSYSDDAVQKCRDIVLAKKNGRVEICIELAPTRVKGGTDSNIISPNWIMMQAKSRFNKDLNKEQAEALFRYMDACGILGEKCGDLQRLIGCFCGKDEENKLIPPVRYNGSGFFAAPRYEPADWLQVPPDVDEPLPFV